MAKDVSETRRQILQAALKRFANGGYAATSVQQIVDDAKVSKPALYYHFADKAGLFQALVDKAHDERFRVMQEAVERGANFRQRAENLLVGLFDYFRANRELVRISIATMFAAPGEVPDSLAYTGKCERNFELIHDLIRQAQKAGELDAGYDSQELAFGFYGQANFYLLAHLVAPDCEPDQLTARKILELFLAGAAPKTRGRKK